MKIRVQENIFHMLFSGIQLQNSFLPSPFRATNRNVAYCSIKKRLFTLINKFCGQCVTDTRLFCFVLLCFGNNLLHIHTVTITPGNCPAQPQSSVDGHRAVGEYLPCSDALKQYLLKKGRELLRHFAHMFYSQLVWCWRTVVAHCS